MITNETATDYGISRYLPRPKDARRGVGLALSGGGYRATLFHLGALRRLNELGLLTRARTITSVSGGSIASAQLARHRIEHGDAWAQPGRPIPRFEEEIAEPMREFTRHDSRTGPVLSRLYPWNWLDRDAAIEGLADRLADGPAGDYRLSRLDDGSPFVFCATDLRFRTLWVFDTRPGKRCVGSDSAGLAPLSDNWTLARAAAASGCFPVAFGPMSVPYDPSRSPGTYEGADRERLVRRLELTDGGLYDDMGVEPIWEDHAVVLVSDAGPSFAYDPSYLGILWGGLRYAVTLMEQATDVRKRWLVSSFIRRDLDGAYWGIASLPTNYEHDAVPPAYSDSLIEKFISQIRIDLDSFSKGEISVLENHGYLMAEIAVRRHAPQLVEGEWPPPVVPHREWMDEERVREALAESAKTKLFARHH